MNLRQVKPCAVIKGTRWLKSDATLIGNFYFMCRSIPQMAQAPYNILGYITLQYIPLSIEGEIAMCPEFIKV
jgi:hypothetical protein